MNEIEPVSRDLPLNFQDWWPFYLVKATFHFKHSSYISEKVPAKINVCIIEFTFLANHI